MNITLNTYSPQRQYGNNSKFTQNKNLRPYNAPAFTGGIEQVAESVAGKSKFFSSVINKCSDGYDRIGEFFAKKVIPPLFDNGFTDKVTNKIKESDNLFSHFLAVGSLITSGMYIYKTLTMDESKMDKDRKKTLAVNQFLTFVLSTAGAYMLDSSLSDWWSKQTVRYAANQCKDEKLSLVDEFEKEVQNTKAENEKIKLDNEALKAAAKKEGRKLVKEELTEYKKVRADKFLKKRIGKYLGTKDEADLLIKKINGMGKLKTMLVFALVYRYIVPVAVTKPANILCEKYLAHKKEKQTEKAGS